MFLASILDDLGVTWVGFIAQVVSVLIVLGILNKFAFGPVTELLLARRKRIEESEANFASSKNAVTGAEAKAQEIVATASAQADRMIKEAQAAAGEAGERRKQEAVAEAAAIIAKAREAGQLEQERALADLKRDFGRLLIDATSKVTGKVLTGDDHNTINQEAAAQISL